MFLTVVRAGNVLELAQTLGHDYKSAHQDVATLETTGLLLGDGCKRRDSFVRVKR